MAEVVAEAQAGSAPAETFDESLLVRIKGKPKKPVRPDEAERSVPVAKLQAEISKCLDRIQVIKETIELKRSAGRSHGAGGGDARGRMQSYKNEFQAVLRQKQHIRDELQAVNKQRDALRTETRALRDKLGRIIPEAELEDRIKKTEFDLNHSSLSAAAEKGAQQQLQTLYGQREPLKQYHLLDATFKSNEGARNGITARLQACDDTLNAIKAQEDGERAELDVVKARADGETSDIPTLSAERQECWEISQALRDQVNVVRSDYDKKYREWVKLDKNFNAWQRWDRNQKYEEARKERESRSDEYKAAEVTSKGELYDNEIYVCDQTLAYLRKFVAADAAKAAANAPPPVAPEGMKLFKKRDVEEDIHMTVAPKKKGNAPKGLNAQQAAARAAEEALASSSRAAAVPAGPKVVKMNHNLDTLRTFMGMEIDPPNTTADVPATIEKVEAKKASYFAKRKAAKEAPPPKAAAPQAPAAAEEEEEEAAAADEEEEEAAAAPADEEEAAAPAEEAEEEAAVAADKDEAAAVDSDDSAAAAPAPVVEEAAASATADLDAATAEAADDDTAAPAEPNGNGAASAHEDEAAAAAEEEVPAPAEVAAAEEEVAAEVAVAAAVQQEEVGEAAADEVAAAHVEDVAAVGEVAALSKGQLKNLKKAAAKKAAAAAELEASGTSADASAGGVALHLTLADSDGEAVPLTLTLAADV